MFSTFRRGWPTFCYNCVDSNHVDGDSDCASPSFFTKEWKAERKDKILKEQQEASVSNDIDNLKGTKKGNKKEGSGFRKGADTQKGNHAGWHG